MGNIVERFNKYICGISSHGMYDFKEKERCVNQYISYMLNKTQSMFEWKNLPETIPQRILELYLQLNGNCCFYKYNNNLYVFVGGLGGEPDVYYMPTIYTIANPALKLSVNAKIDVDCVVVPNDSMYLGLLPLCNKYATLQTEIDLSIKIAVVNTRIVNLISSPDDRTKVSAEKYLEDIEKGENGVIAENAFLDGIRSQPYGNVGSHNLTELLEMLQYIKGSWYNDLGLNANYNMKRETLTSSETQLNNDMLFPLVDNMLESRQKGIEKVNKMFGTNISVDFSSSWKDNQIEIDELLNEISGQPENKEGVTNEKIE